MLVKLSRVDGRFEALTLERPAKCGPQREKGEKIYRMVRGEESIMFMDILWLTWPCLAVKGLGRD
jgi:hypothetical protein